jgi:hypothetical protein
MSEWPNDTQELEDAAERSASGGKVILCILLITLVIGFLHDARNQQMETKEHEQIQKKPPASETKE